MRLSLRLYTLAWWLATPLVMGYLLWRSLRQPAYRAHWAERWGFGAARPADDAPVLWIHAVSVGESRAAQPLVAELRARYPRVRILFTAMTPTGRATARELFGDTITQVYLPYDYPGAMRRFLRRWRPALGLVMETELWPNLVAQARREGVPMALVNARLSARSLRKGERWRALIAPALAGLETVVAQTVSDADRLARLGRTHVAVVGNVKFDVTPAPALRARGQGWRAAVGGRRVLLCASTRDGEEALILAAWTAHAAAVRDGVRLVIVPRHPQRFDEVAALCRRSGLDVVRRSEGAFDDGRPLRANVVLGDSMGEMVAWYALADVAVIGGSLLPFGAQNLIEACAVSVPVIVGPHTFNFAQAAEEAIAAGAALRVVDAAEAIAQALAVLADEPVRHAMSEAAGRFMADHRGATARTLVALAPLLTALEATGVGTDGTGRAGEIRTES